MPDPITRWAHALAQADPTIATVRLGHGFDERTGVSTVWLDLITRDGWHRAADQKAALPDIPMDVHLHVLDTVALGHWVDVT